MPDYNGLTSLSNAVGSAFGGIVDMQKESRAQQEKKDALALALKHRQEDIAMKKVADRNKTQEEAFGHQGQAEFDDNGQLSGITPFSKPASEKDAAETAKYRAEAAKAYADAGNKGKKITPGQEAIDKNYAQEFNEWTTSGKPEIEKNLAKLDQAAADLSKEKNETFPSTGRIMGRLPDWAKSEKAIQTRDNVRSAVNNTLKATLGAQFTEKEGERIMNQAYNENLSPQENVEKIQSLVKSLRGQAQNREDKAQYFNKYGSLEGFLPKGSGLLAQDKGLLPETPAASPDRATALKAKLADIQAKKNGSKAR